MGTKYVRIHYGPCQSPAILGLPEHRPLFLAGLTHRLRQLGYRVEVVQVKYINYCMVEMCGRKVFQCNLLHLKFNMPCRRDEVCQRAVDSVVEATELLARTRNYQWVSTLLDEIVMRSFASQYSPTEQWRPDPAVPGVQLSCLAPCPCHMPSDFFSSMSMVTPSGLISTSSWEQGDSESMSSESSEESSHSTGGSSEEIVECVSANKLG